MSDIGYIRDGRIPADQQLVGVQLDKIFTDIRETNGRQQYECEDYLHEGDTLHLHTIEIIAKSPSDLCGYLEGIISEGVTVKFHKEGIFFTNNEDDMMSRFVLQLLKAFADLDWAFFKGGR